MTTFAQVTAVHELYRDEWLLCFGNEGKLQRQRISVSIHDVLLPLYSYHLSRQDKLNGK
jgi:hypothetical protein